MCVLIDYSIYLLLLIYSVQHNSSTNSTLDDNQVTFPLDGRSLYVDATHEVVILHGAQ
jgi:hypothetical protein